MKTLRPLAMLLSAFALASCEKNAVQDITGSLPASQIRFFNFGVNAPTVNFYANDTKVTATLSTTGAELTTGVASGGVGSSGYYAGLAPGNYNFSGRISATVDKDLVIATVPFTLAEGKKYSLYISGIYDAAGKKAEGFVVEDPIPTEFDYTVMYLRFVNAIPNSPPLTLYFRNPTTGVETAVGAAVPYKSAGGFIPVPNGVYDVFTRTAGSTAIQMLFTNISLPSGRYGTIAARGDYTVTGTTAVTRPQLTYVVNR
ncbi:MAG: DUF4397 domain-containing protein [Phycisphaerae bacterium]|nr:DUF4397 domain-containing protein [Gemmatimonadaceae bacterium]